MPQTTERYKNYLENYKFFSNSIDFRIKSSKAIEKWKNVQAFQMDQLVNGKFYFPSNRREILLLKYDLWSRWIFEIENLFIEISGDNPLQYDHRQIINLIISLADKTMCKYKEIILDENNVKFDKEFSTIWMEMHESAHRYLIHTFRMNEGMNIDQLFITIVNTLCEVLQYTLIEIHELDVIHCRYKSTACTDVESKDCVYEKCTEDEPFIVITGLSEKAFLNYGVSLTYERLMVYKKYYKFKRIYLKNYTDEGVAPQIIERIENLGFEVDYRRSLVKW